MDTFVCRVTLGKGSFAGMFFAVLALPSVALRKLFAECFLP